MWVVAQVKRLRGNKESDDVNRLLRKLLYREFALWNGTLAGWRNKHPACVEKGIRELFPSKYYMGFKRIRNDPDNTAVDNYGKKVPGVKWAKKEEGKYESKFDKTS